MGTTILAITTIATTVTVPATPMDDAALYRLLAWLSPGYPVGAFAYSHGLEWAVEAGDVGDETGLAAWVGDVLAHAAGRSDAVLFRHAYEAAEEGAADEVAALALALAPSAERRLETVAQGNAFLTATRDVWPAAGIDTRDQDVAYPVAVARAARAHGVPLRPALHAYLHAFAANVVSAGVRLIPLGQTAGQRVLAGLEPVIAASLDAALVAPLDELGGSGFRADLASMRHETQYTRLFRS